MSNGSNGGLNVTPRQIIGMSLLVLTLVAALTVLLVFHYPQSSDVTAVLGVVFPTLTLVLGGVAGSTAGRSVGAAGKLAVQAKLDDARRRMVSASEETESLVTVLGSVAKRLRTAMPSRAGESHLLLEMRPVADYGPTAHGAEPAFRTEPLVDLEDLDSVTASLARIRTLLKVPEE